MKTYSVASLKAKLSKILNEVQNGEEVTVTDHNRSIAKLISIKTVPPIKDVNISDLLKTPLIELKKNALSSSELIRRIRDEE